MRHIFLLTLLTTTLAACDGPTPAPAPAPNPEAPPPVPPAPALAPATPPPPSPVAAPRVDAKAQRRQAALDLLSDGRSASALELVAASPDHPFDAALADKLSPKTVVHGVPQVAQRTQSSDGPLDRDIVRRIVRAHINEVRYCYNQGLEEDHRLAGRVVIDFEVLANGSVGTAAVGKSTLPDPAVNTCIAAAVRRWKFPAAAAATKISYPFELSPAQ